jgi:hypothetical protein
MIEDQKSIVVDSSIAAEGTEPCPTTKILKQDILK